MRLFSCKISKIQTSPRQKVLRLPHIHPIPLQIKRMQLPITSHLRKHLLLNTGRSQWDAFQNIGIKNVNTRINPIRDELDWFLYESLNLGCLWFHDHHAVFRGFFYLCDDDGSFLSVGFMEGGKLAEGVVLR